MYRRAIIITLAFAIILFFGASPRAQAARFCFGSVPIACAIPLKAKALQTLNHTATIAVTPPVNVPAPSWLERDRWKYRLAIDYNFVQTNAVGTQGSGKAIDAVLKVTLPGNRLSNSIAFSRYNVDVPTLHYCPTCGQFFYDYEDENDDYYILDDFLDYWCGYDEYWGIGVSYYDFHPIYAQGSYNMSGFGFGIDRAPDEGSTYSLYGSYYYYPSVSGRYSMQTSGGFQIMRYDAGLNYHPLLTNGLSFQLGLKGETWIGKGQAQNYRVMGAYLGSAFNW